MTKEAVAFLWFAVYTAMLFVKKIMLTPATMHEESMDLLIAKYLDHVASPDEMKLVEDWYDSFDRNPPFYFPNTLALIELMEAKFSDLRQKTGMK